MARRKYGPHTRLVRHRRVRKRVRGTGVRPRLAVFRSNRHIYAQVIDDERGHTIVAASSAESGHGAGTKTEVAGTVGAALARKAIEAGVKQVVFDRGGYKYHGRVSALAEAARGQGLEF